MSFAVQLESDHVLAEAGANTALTVEVVNRGEATDQFEIEIEGLDPEWTAIPVPSFSVARGDTQRAMIFFKPSRTTENTAGSYPFAVRVRSLESGEARTVQGVVQIKPYFHLTMELNPRKGSFSPTTQNNGFTTSVVNLGNAELTLQLYGSDPEDALAFEFGAEQIILGPGQQKDVALRVTPTQKRAFSSPRLHGFTVSARSVDHPGVVAAAQAQLEQKPLLSPGSLLAAILIAILAIGWMVTLPKAPVMDNLDVDQNTVAPGEQIKLTWGSSNSKAVKISFGSRVLQASARPDGTLEMQATTSGEFIAVALRDGRESQPMRVAITVKAPEKGPAPVIGSFELSDRSVEPGEKIFVRYKVENAVKLTLLPTQQLLDPTVDEFMIEAPNRPGTYRFQLVAVNASGDQIESDEIRLSVAYEPQATIESFRAEPDVIDEAVAKTTIRWVTKKATKIRLKAFGQVIDLSDPSGQMELDVFKAGEATLEAEDERGMTTSKTIRLGIKKADPKPDDSPPPSDEGGSGTTGTTGTTGAPGATTKTGANR